MLDVRYLTRVPVAMLRHDLYVAEADRPWDEIPVMFQGFLIRTDEELKVLRAYCSFVYVEEARSRDGVFATLQQDLRSGGVSDHQSPGQQDISAAIGRQRHPDKSRLRERLASAADSRSAAGVFLSSAWDDARLGRSLNSRQAGAVVDDLVSQVSGNTSASLWLTNLARKDDYSTAHSINVCVITLVFGMEQGLRGRRLENLGLGALLHDIGKVDQPNERLNRAGSLNRAEWQVMMRHADDGAEKVAAAGNIPGEVLDIIRMHHERIDGTGYPRGLRDEQVPETVRLVGLVNRYDSLTSDRPYRPGRPADEVLQELYNDSESAYGAELVQAFIHCIGIFPIGSLVELDNGALGVIVGSSPENRLKPTVLLVRTPSGDDYQKRLLVNLAADPEPAGPSSQHIKRVVNPARYGIDVAGIVAFEFGVDF